MTAIKDLFGSERGLLGLMLIVCCTVLAALGNVTFDDWQNYTKWVFLIYVGGKTVTGAVQIAKGTSKDPMEMSDAELAETKAKAATYMKKMYGIDFEQMMKDSAEHSAKHEERMAQLNAEIEAAKTASGVIVTPEPPKAA